MQWWQIFIIFIGAAVLLASASLIYRAWEFLDEPLVIREYKVDNSPVARGEPIIVSASFHRAKLCSVMADQFMFKLPELLVLARERLPAGFARADEIVRVPVPTTRLDAGQYLLRVVLNSDCGYRLYTYELPDLSFEIR